MNRELQAGSIVIPVSLTCEIVIIYFTSISGIAGKPIIPAEALQEAWHKEQFDSREVQVDELCGTDVLNHVLHRFTERSDGLDGFNLVEVKDLFHNLYFGPHRSISRRLLTEMKEADFNLLRSCLEGLLRSATLYDFIIVRPHVEGVGDGAAARLRSVLVAHPQSGTTLEDHDISLPNVSLQTVRDALRGLPSIPDRAVDFLMTHLPHIGGGSLLDLSDMNLSVGQITRLLSACPHIRHLSISHNARVVVEDIPELLRASPTMLRLNVIGCELIDGDSLCRLMRGKPWLFRQLEGLMHPSLLTILPKPVNFPISFTFIFAHHGFHAVTMSLFTPALVLQALATLLPTVWKEHDISYELLEQPQDILLRGHSLSTLLTHSGTSSLSAGMMGYVAFTAGTYPTDPSRSGTSADKEWYFRPVVSVPLHPHAVVSDQPGGSWAFLLEWSESDNSIHQRQTPEPGEFHRRQPRTKGYAFIHYEYPWSDLAGTESTEASRRRRDHVSVRRGRAYDLYGFLRCMADEGRQLPPVEMVQRVAEFLCARHEPDGEQICPPIMDNYELPAMSVRVPSYNFDADMFEMLNNPGIESKLRNLGQLPLDVWERLLEKACSQH